MMQLVEANWPVLLAALLIGLLVAWLIFRANRKTTIKRDPASPDPDAPAQRNQALIDAPPVASHPDPVAVPGAVGGAAIAATAAAHVPEAKLDKVDAADGDDLTRIKGVGPKLAALLGQLGVISFAQIAAWDDAEIDRIDGQLGRFQGRIRRDDWMTQARYLADGDSAGYEAQFGRL